MQPVVSVVVPVFRVQENLLRKCIQSCICQDEENIEILLVDDCSQDQSSNICDEYASKDSRIKVIHKKENEGLSAARNTGVDYATGEWVTFLDGDDWIEKDTCSLVQRVNNQSIQMLIFGAVREYENHTVPFTMSYEDGHIFKEKECKQLQIDVLDYNKRLATAYGKFVRNSFLKEYSIRHDPEVRCGIEGIEYNLRLFGYLNSAVFFAEYKYHYVYNLQSITGAPSEKNNEYLLLGLERMYKYIQERPEHELLERQYEIRVQRVVMDISLGCYFNPNYNCDYKKRKEKLKDFLNRSVIKHIVDTTSCYEKSVIKKVMYNAAVKRLYPVLLMLGVIRIRVLGAR